ncbi:MAG TPA: tetratricopeptide repeat protein [Candidatus Omnitrophota bacterium]|nr:tetratricopeptide repeat protein [Candidatus Omnitrophota bacterium]
MRRVIAVLALAAAAFIISLLYHSTQKPSINFYQGHRLFLSGKYLQAAPFLEKSLELSPGNKEAELELGYSYLWTGRPGEAIPFLLKAEADFPNDKKITCALADAYSWNRQYDEAVAILREKLLETGNITVKKKLAELYLWSGKYDKAENILGPILERDPRDMDALFMMGKALYYSGNSLEASSVLERMLKESNEK